MASQFESVRWNSSISLEHGSRITGLYRLENGLSCVLNLERRGGAWEVAAVHLHPARDAVVVGPIDEELTSDHDDLADEGLVAIETSQTTLDLAQAAASEVPVPVTTRVLRDLPLGQLVDDLRRRAYERLEATYEAGLPLRGQDVSDDRRERARSEWVEYLEGDWSRPGRKGRPDVFFAGVAAEYVKHLATGSRSPVRDIAEARHHAVSTVNNWIRKARELGLLTDAPPGRAGGELTTRARDLLS